MSGAAGTTPVVTPHDTGEVTARLLTGDAPDLASHLARHGGRPAAGDPRRLAAVAEAAGLTGRGGAGFPTSRKLAAAATDGSLTVVANGAEGEPASAKDRTLLTHAPHLVLDGLAVVAESLRAARAVVYVADDTAAMAVTRAVAERQRARADSVDIAVVRAPDRFVAGEESAVAAALEGRPARPSHRLVPLMAAASRPTLVQNVETLAQLAVALRHGPGWFRAAGTDEEPGTLLVTVSGAVRTPQVAEVALGTPVRSVLALAGGPSSPLRAVLVGGYHGSWLDAGALDAPLSRAGLAPFGGSPGAGVLVALPRSRCPLAFVSAVASYLAGESAGQCGPCLNGLPALADELARLRHVPADPGVAERLARLGRLTAGRGACRHPDGTVRMVTSALTVFGDDVAAHLGGWCTARTVAGAPGQPGRRR